MSVLGSVVLGLIGAAVVVATVLSAVRTTVLPRAAGGLFVRAIFKATRFVFKLWVGRSASYDRRDRVMAMFGPIALFMLLATWMVLVVAAFTVLFLVDGVTSLPTALSLSGASITTLGTEIPHGAVPTVLSYIEAAVGLLLLTLMITFLPSIYGAFSRREAGVSLLQVRAGDPPRAATLLIRHYRIDPDAVRLKELWRTWESWFTDIEETHTTFQVLAFFRSPQPARSWITAAGTLLDAAGLWIAAVEHDRDPDAAWCLRTGFLTLRRLGASFGLLVEPEPTAGDPIAISRWEWEEVLDELAAAGLPVKADRDEAWKAWAGWRVNYDVVLLELARLVEAPLAPWVSDRSPVVSPRRSRMRGWTRLAS